MVKALKENIYVDYSIEDIQDSMEGVMKSLKGEEIVVLKRMFRNLKYVFPENFYEIDPFRIRETIFTSKVKNGQSSGRDGRDGRVEEQNNEGEILIEEEVEAGENTRGEGEEENLDGEMKEEVEENKEGILAE